MGRQTHCTQGPGEAETVEQAEGERNEPRLAFGETRRTGAALSDFRGEKHDA